MVISVVDMITEARAQIELVTPEAVSKELAARALSIRSVEWSDRSAALSKCLAGCWSSSPTQQVLATTPNCNPHAG